MTRMFSPLNFALASVVALSSWPALAADDSAAASSATEAPARDDGPPLLFGENLDIGGYGGLDVAYARMFGRDGALVGAQGAVLINHRLALGLAGYGWTNPADGPVSADGDAQRFETGYGGVTLRYSFYFDQLPVYLTVGGLLGGGAIDLTERDREGIEERGNDDAFAIFQPDVSINANLTRWMRVGITGGYRITSGIDHLGFEESDVNGFMLGGQIQFGSF